MVRPDAPLDARRPPNRMPVPVRGKQCSRECLEELRGFDLSSGYDEQLAKITPFVEAVGTAGVYGAVAAPAAAGSWPAQAPR